MIIISSPHTDWKMWLWGLSNRKMKVLDTQIHFTFTFLHIDIFHTWLLSTQNSFKTGNSAHILLSENKQINVWQTKGFMYVLVHGLRKHIYVQIGVEALEDWKKRGKESQNEYTCIWMGYCCSSHILLCLQNAQNYNCSYFNKAVIFERYMRCSI